MEGHFLKKFPVVILEDIAHSLPILKHLPNEQKISCKNQLTDIKDHITRLKNENGLLWSNTKPAISKGKFGINKFVSSEVSEVEPFSHQRKPTDDLKPLVCHEVTSIDETRSSMKIEAMKENAKNVETYENKPGIKQFDAYVENEGLLHSSPANNFFPVGLSYMTGTVPPTFNYNSELCRKRVHLSIDKIGGATNGFSDEPVGSMDMIVEPRKYNQIIKQQRCPHSCPGNDCYVCKVCGEHFSIKYHLALHRRSDCIEEYRFKCNNCGRKFFRLCDFNNHRSSRSCVKRFRCEHCLKEFPSIPLLVDHMRSHTQEAPYNCDVCQRRFSLRSNLLRHMKIVHLKTGERFQCEECLKWVSSKSVLKRHIDTHLGTIKKYSCDQCGKRFFTLSALRVHMKCHTNEGFLQCERCGKLFAGKRDLSQHMVSHSGEKEFQCEICSKYFSLKCNLLTHIKSVHSEEKVFTCSNCGKRFRSVYSLKSHLFTHSTNKRFLCNDCGKQFGTASGLTEHLKYVHSQQRKMSCKKCGKEISRKGHLKRHMETHMVGREYVNCNICGKRFTDKCNLSQHTKIHTGIKPFTCIDCGKQYLYKISYINHMILHSGKKSFCCRICAKTFALKDYLKQHLRRHCS